MLGALPDALIVRTSWMYGHGGEHFPGKVLRWAAGGGPLRVVDDQVGSPTYAEDLATGLKALTERGATGLYHLGGSGCVSRLEWARETLAVAGLDVQVLARLQLRLPSAGRSPRRQLPGLRQSRRPGRHPAAVERWASPLCPVQPDLLIESPDDAHSPTDHC